VARDYPRLSWLAKVDRRFDTPIHSIVITSVWASVLVLWGNFEQLLFFYAFANWLVFALIGISVFILKKRDGSLSVTGYPVIPILFIASCVWICITTIQHAPQAALFGALLMLTGLPVYWFVKAGDRKQELEPVIASEATQSQITEQ